MEHLPARDIFSSFPWLVTLTHQKNHIHAPLILGILPNLCCCCSVTELCPTLCNPMGCSTLVFPVFHCLLEFAHTHVHWVSDAIQPSHPLSSPSPLTLSLSQHELELHIRWPEYWGFSISVSPSSECSGLISFRTDWFDFLAVQGTLKSLLQHPSSKASISGARTSLWSNFHIHIWPLEKP